MSITDNDIARLIENTNADAAQVKGLIEGTIDPEQFESVQGWLRQCYNRPSDHELRMHALNEVLGGFGVEAIRPDGSEEIVAEYINQGDTYDTTLVYDIDQGEYIVTSWGDWYEAYEAEQDQDDDDEYDAELAADQILERQELEDFEQADEYFGGYGGEDW